MYALTLLQAFKRGKRKVVFEIYTPLFFLSACRLCTLDAFYRIVDN